jgi:hypothetical protein
MKLRASSWVRPGRLLARLRVRGRHTPFVYFDELGEPPDIAVREPPIGRRRSIRTPGRYRHFDAPIFLHNAVLDKR